MGELVDPTDFDKTNLENLEDSQSLTLNKFIFFCRALSPFRTETRRFYTKKEDG